MQPLQDTLEMKTPKLVALFLLFSSIFSLFFLSSPSLSFLPIFLLETRSKEQNFFLSPFSLFNRTNKGGKVFLPWSK